MANDELPILQDILFNSVAMFSENNEDNLFRDDFADIDNLDDSDPLMSPLDLFPIDYFEKEEPWSIDELFSISSFDIPQNISTSQQQYIIPSVFPSIDVKHETNISLSFINPPEPFYHVRYLSEITNSPVNDNVVNTGIKTKKNISGRYLKGKNSRYVTIALPLILSDHSNLFIRVTRLTVPYQDISFIHPYPLLYSKPKKKAHSYAITQGSSIYYKITKEDICSCSKKFPNIILTRWKQSQLKQIDNLYTFDNSDTAYPFSGANPKEKISKYQLKKSQLDFRLVQLEQDGKFTNSDIFCRSNELIEEEGFNGRNRQYN